MDAKIVTRAAAKAAGLKRYFTGKPCVRGHTTERYAAGGCVECHRENTAVRHADGYYDEWTKAAKLANPDRYKEYQRKYRRNNIEKVRRAAREHMRRAKAANPEKFRARARSYAGLPEPTRPAPSACECCGAAAFLLEKALCLDHDHKTGKFRGWVCDRCNTGLGKLGDSVEGLRKAVAYLERAA